MAKSLRDLQRVCAIALAIAILSTPVLTNLAMAQASSAANEMAEGRVTGEADAESATNKGLWFIAGCLGGVLGLIISYVYTPTPPSSRLLGKSPEYVAAYSDAYREKAKKLQTNMALTGCGVGAVAYIVYVVLVIGSTTTN